MDTSSIDERVARGIAFLDEREPGWREKVDPEKLDMQLLNRYMFGQVYGDFEDGMRKHGLGVNTWSADDRDHPAFQIGILTLNKWVYTEGRDEAFRRDTNFELLTEAWQRALQDQTEG